MKHKSLLLTSLLLIQTVPLWAMDSQDDENDERMITPNKKVNDWNVNFKKSVDELDTLSLSSIGTSGVSLDGSWRGGSDSDLSYSEYVEDLLGMVTYGNETISSPNSAKNLPAYLRKKLNDNNVDLNSMLKNSMEQTGFFGTFEAFIDSSIRGARIELIKKMDPKHIFPKRLSAMQYIINKNVKDHYHDLFKSYYLDMYFDAFKNANLPSNFNITSWFMLSAVDCFDNFPNFVLKTLQENMKTSPLTDPDMMCCSYVLMPDQNFTITNDPQRTHQIIKDYFTKVCNIQINGEDNFLPFFNMVVMDSISIIGLELKEFECNNQSTKFNFNFHILKDTLDVTVPNSLKHPSLRYYFDVLLEKIFESKEPSKIFKLFSFIGDQAYTCFTKDKIISTISPLLERHILNLVKSITECDFILNNDFNCSAFEKGNKEVFCKLNDLFNILSNENIPYLREKPKEIIINGDSIKKFLLEYLVNNFSYLTDKYKTQRTSFDKGREYFLGTSSSIKEAYFQLLKDAGENWNDFVSKGEIDAINTQYAPIFETEDKKLAEVINNGKNTITSFISSSATVISGTFGNIIGYFGQANK